jgi:hypothetical protein
MEYSSYLIYAGFSVFALLATRLLFGSVLKRSMLVSHTALKVAFPHEIQEGWVPAQDSILKNPEIRVK